MSLLFAGHILTNIADASNVPQNPWYWGLHPLLGGPDMIELPNGAEVPKATDQASVRYWLTLDNGGIFEVNETVASMDHSMIEGDGFNAAFLRAIIGGVAPSVITAPVDPTYELPVYHETPPQEMPAQWVPFFHPDEAYLGDAVMGPLPDEAMVVDESVHLVGVQEDMGPYPVGY